MIDKNKLTLVIGGSGRIGQYLVKTLREEGYYFIAPSHGKMNILNPNNVYDIFDHYKPHYAINLYGETTTIALNRQNPVEIFEKTMLGNTNLIKNCHRFKVEKLVNIISSCAYPGNKEILREAEFWDGSPHESVRPHGLAKRNVYAMSQFYRQEYGLNVVCLCLNSTYGGIKDWNDPSKLKAADSLVKRFVDAKINNVPEILLWGTGKPFREWIYTPDAAEGILQAFEKYDNGELLNIGSGLDRSIRSMANYIKNITEYKGKTLWDTSKPDGQMKKLFSTQKQKDIIDWKPKTSFIDGLIQVVNEYKEYLNQRK